MTPLAHGGSFATLSDRLAPAAGSTALPFVAAVAVLGWSAERPLVRAVERSFWSLNALAAMAVVQSERVRTRAADGGLGAKVATTLKRESAVAQASADAGALRHRGRVARLWRGVFPLVAQPPTAEGLGDVLLNANAETNCSSTRALGLVPVAQAHALSALHVGVRTRSLMALHHHVVEHP